MNPVPLFLIIVTLPLLLGGCGDKPNLYYEIEGDTVTITYDFSFKKPSGKLVIPATIEGKTVTSIGYMAFAGCTSLTSITIPDGVTSIDRAAFWDCASLTSIKIPDSVTSIGGRAFWDCASLTTIEVSAGNADYTIVNGVLFNKEKTVLHTYPAGKTGDKYNIPERVTYIEESAFYGSTSLTSITIPDSVTSIGDETFYGCISLTSITIPDIVTSIGSAAFKECTSLASITIPETVSYISFWAFLGCTSLKNVTFLGDAPEIAVSVFDRGATIYRKPEAKGWGDTFGGRPVKLISEKL